MSTAKQSRRKSGTTKLEPIDWHEFANDAVLNGNMSTLYHRPANEDPTAYASSEALLEIEKRAGRPAQSAVVIDFDSPVASTDVGPALGQTPTVGTKPPALQSMDYGGSIEDNRPTVGTEPPVSTEIAAPTVGSRPIVGTSPTVGPISAVGVAEAEQTELSDANLNIPLGQTPTVGTKPPALQSMDYGGSIEDNRPTVGTKPPVGPIPAVGVAEAEQTELSDANLNVSSLGIRPAVSARPTVGVGRQRRRSKPIRDVQDALTLAGQVLYKAMYGAPDGAKSKSCTKGYRQLAAETHLDKDTVRDLISEFKGKGIVRETGSYDPDTRSAKTYEVLSYKAILQMWRDAGLAFVTAGRSRRTFCTVQGEPLALRPTVGTEPAVQPQPLIKDNRPTVGLQPTVGLAPVPPNPAGLQASQRAQAERLQGREVIQALQQIIGGPVDQEAADRLVNNCRAVAADCTIEEIVEFAWSKAFLCRSGKIGNPVGFLITQVPKHFQGEALHAYRDKKRKELEVAAEIVARDEQQRREIEREMAELEERHRVRTQIAERHRKDQGIDLKAVLQDDPEADDILKEWAKRMLKLGYRYRPRYD